MEKQSGITFDQAEVALARQWLGHDDLEEVPIPSVLQVKSPTALQSSSLSMRMFSGFMEDNQGTGGDTVETTDIPVPKSYEEATTVVERFERAAPRSDTMVADTVGQHVQLDKTALADEVWVGTSTEEAHASVFSVLLH
jgi:phospholipase D1/2